nr:cation transporter [Klebsiella variicola]
MTCDSCAVHVKDALEKVPGVQSADVSYAKGSAKLAIEVGTSPDALTAAVAGLGYRATLADAPQFRRRADCSTRCAICWAETTRRVAAAHCISPSSAAAGPRWQRR